MTVEAATVRGLVEAEVGKLGDARVASYIRKLLVEPTPAPRDWDYAKPGDQYICWTVLEHPLSNNSIAYCEDGFGPGAPWGLLFMTGEYMSMGMDTQWYPTFLQTFFESKAATNLRIWRVFKTNATGVREAITSEGTWDETWAIVMARRSADPTARYDCDTSITYERE